MLSDGFHWWWLEANYLLGCTGGYFIHWLGHRKESGRWCSFLSCYLTIRFRAHTSEHHIKLYPPQRFLNEKSLVSRDPNAKFYYPLLAATFIVSYFVLGGAFFGIICFVHVGFALLVADYLHGGFHAKGFWLENRRWFIALRELHYLHHKGHMTGIRIIFSCLSFRKTTLEFMIFGWISF